MHELVSTLQSEMLGRLTITQETAVTYVHPWLQCVRPPFSHQADGYLSRADSEVNDALC